MHMKPLPLTYLSMFPLNLIINFSEFGVSFVNIFNGETPLKVLEIMIGNSIFVPAKQPESDANNVRVLHFHHLAFLCVIISSQRAGSGINFVSIRGCLKRLFFLNSKRTKT